MSDLLRAPDSKDAPRPLADRLRPQSFAEVRRTGSSARPWRADALIRSGSPGSLVFWGLRAPARDDHWRGCSRMKRPRLRADLAIFSGVAEFEEDIRGSAFASMHGRGTLLFVDEIHRFNRARNRIPFAVMETGTVTLIGATTENPSVRTQRSASVARARDDVSGRSTGSHRRLLERRSREGKNLRSTKTRARPVAMADGDGRAHRDAWRKNIWRARRNGRKSSTAPSSRRSCNGARRSTTKAQEDHYNLISALHKTVRGSDPDAASIISHACSMAAKILFIARRVVRMAIEDIGLADPQALVVANAAKGRLRFSRQPPKENWRSAGGRLLRDRARNRTPPMAFKA